jgi:hypothetical protein
MDTLTRDEVSVRLTPNLTEFTYEELQECHQSWLKLGRETFNDLVLIADELGQQFTKHTRTYKQFIYPFENEFGVKCQAAIMLFSDVGTYLLAKKKFSHTNIIGVMIKMPKGETQVCYLVDTNDPNHRGYTEYYIPGYWEFTLPQYAAEAMQHKLKRETGGREKARQNLLQMLDKGGV